ncbi:hypothetical protein OS121_29735 [Mycolicibacterium mucogenicum]|uniref:hypothetical protein n=1 Tax=Mycolicibacterium mucogenicum TaxID=56689 RepID=UPI002269F965|nr:hypothetical protein [Mycolicibacterium mucogenicum]MCX8559231.1 hypothetical protein [Mycolicibacterium mucogenicum]
MAQPWKGPREQIRFEVPVELRSQLQAMAAEQGVFVTDLVSDMVEQALQRTDLVAKIRPLSPPNKGPDTGLLKFRLQDVVMLELKVKAAEHGARAVTEIAYPLIGAALGRADLVAAMNRRPEELPLAI